GGRLVFHDHALAERLAELVGDDARGNIGRSAGAEADHEAQRPRGIRLLRARRAGGSEREQQQRTDVSVAIAMARAALSPPPQAGEGQGGGTREDLRKLTPSPALPRKRGREQIELAARVKQLRRNPLHDVFPACVARAPASWPR